MAQPVGLVFEFGDLRRGDRALNIQAQRCQVDGV
jgi:hypothetical protein